jgi:hypothetical protein
MIVICNLQAGFGAEDRIANSRATLRNFVPRKGEKNEKRYTWTTSHFSRELLGMNDLKVGATGEESPGEPSLRERRQDQMQTSQAHPGTHVGYLGRTALRKEQCAEQ